ncbi:GGDEF domain-containing protein [Candidatus Accumulibacter aalborgensis]|nr:sensor domain-containing diguanylate cyclase [Candidatus Accumulibacter aalborgensis]
MLNSQNRLPLVDLRADDAEIGRYAELLDSLSIGLLVFAANGALQQSNTQAGVFLGSTPTLWEDENGRPLADQERPEMQVVMTHEPLRQRAIGIRHEQSRSSTWYKASAFPVFADDGSLRRVLVTLADLTRDTRLASEGCQLPTHDPLTGVFNQRHILLLLDDESRRAQRYGTPFALSLLAIDNSSGGGIADAGQARQQLLADLGRLLAGSLREFDMIGRFGEDQFLLILPNVRVNEAMVGLERLREAVEASHLMDSSEANDSHIHEPWLTISGGVTEYTGEDAGALIERVQSLLASARETGGNRLCVNMDMF